MLTARPIDATFRALSDPTRLGVVERLCLGPASMSELLGPLAISMPTLSKHLGVLEASGLVHSKKRGRVRTFRLDAERLGQAEQWLSRQRRLWEQRLDQLDDYLKTMKDES